MAWEARAAVGEVAPGEEVEDPGLGANDDFGAVFENGGGEEFIVCIRVRLGDGFTGAGVDDRDGAIA